MFDILDPLAGPSAPGRATGTLLRPIRNRYRMTNPTMIHARVATTTLPPNTSGKKRPQLSFDQGATVGKPFRRRPLESPLLLVTSMLTSAASQADHHLPAARLHRSRASVCAKLITLDRNIGGNAVLTGKAHSQSFLQCEGRLLAPGAPPDATWSGSISTSAPILW
jgi:hypothetical protein